MTEINSNRQLLTLSPTQIERYQFFSSTPEKDYFGLIIGATRQFGEMRLLLTIS